MSLIKKSIGSNVVWVLTVALVTLLSATVAQAITCEECMELEKEKKTVKKELDEKRKAMKAAFESKDYTRLQEIRSRITELQSMKLKFDKQSEDCLDACRPDEIKRVECQNLKKEIKKLETETSGSNADLAAIDERYKQLRDCNTELRRQFGID